MGYVYKGSQFDAHVPIPSMRGLDRGPAKCGTRSGYARHLREGEEVCGLCREAKKEYDRGYRKRRAIKEAA